MNVDPRNLNVEPENLTPDPNTIDVPFSVPFVHRLRVTDDVCGANFSRLREVLSGGEGGVKVLVIAESALAQAGQTIADRLAADESIDLVSPPVTVGGGEQVKNSSSLVDDLLRRINEADLDRRSYVVAIGGGAMLDAVGYAAAIAHRGIRLVRVWA